MTPELHKPTVQDEVRAVADRLAAPLNAMDNGARAAVMMALLRNAVSSVRYTGEPDRAALIRLAGHAVCWAESVRK